MQEPNGYGAWLLPADHVDDDVAILYYCFGPVLFFLVARTRMAREVAG